MRTTTSPVDPDTTPVIHLAEGRTLLLDPASQASDTLLQVHDGIARVFCACPETDGMSLAFLQKGDTLQFDRLCSDGVCLEALTDLSFRRLERSEAGLSDPVNEWTLQLLRIRHLVSAEQRLQALLSLLVHRIGRRTRAGCQLPFRLTHERLGELIGATRVTTSRIASKLRERGVFQQGSGSREGLTLCPDWIAACPLTF
nr:Crp/Fnr family transcriptional regulator [Synechococcus sp. RSCCF101]